jgi:hypothetical protein
MAEIAAAKKPVLTAYQLAVALARHDVPTVHADAHREVHHIVTERCTKP